MVQHLTAMGMQSTKLYQTKGHPIVYSEYAVNDNLPTLLLYGHYDVQPADPYELRDSDPFSAEVRDGYLYARGVSDDKGQFFVILKLLKPG